MRIEKDAFEKRSIKDVIEQWIEKDVIEKRSINTVVHVD
jgi:hypothetical protein